MLSRAMIGVGVAALLAVGALAALPASAQLASRNAGGASGFPACPDPASAPAMVSTPCLAIATFGKSVDRIGRASAVRGAGAVVRFNYGIVDAVAVMVPNQRSYWALANHPDLQGLVPDRPVHSFGPPGGCTPWPACKNDSGGGTGAGTQVVPDGVRRVGADLVRSTYTGINVTVAIVDTGVDSAHEDLAGAVVGGVSCLGTLAAEGCSNDGGLDDNGHGTHVAGIVAARDNQVDVVGVAPGASLVSVKVLDSSGSGSDSNVIAGLDWVYNGGSPPRADVINMSLGRSGSCLDRNADPSAALIENALANLVTNGVSVVVAAGNDSSKEVKDMVPAGCPEVMAVASTSALDGTSKCRFLPDDILADTASYFTTDGAWDSTNGVGVTTSAPGESWEDNTCGTIQSTGIESLAMGGGTVRMSGTSMASPHVAGLVALYLQKNSGAKPDEVRTALRASADLAGTAPIPNPYVGSDDGEKEGIAYAPVLVGPAS